MVDRGEAPDQRHAAQRGNSLSALSKWTYRALGALLALVGLTLLAGGVMLALLGGSWYYLIAGAGLAVSGYLLARRDLRSAWLFAAIYGGTIIWALWEAGLSFWPQVPRLGPFIVMGMIMTVATERLPRANWRVARGLLFAQTAVLVLAVVGMFEVHGARYGTESSATAPRDAGNVAQASDWQYYGGDSGATHFAPFEAINRGNIDRLKVAWTFRTGEINDSADFEATPLQIGNSLYFCTAHNRIFSIDADTGRKNWLFDPHTNVKGNWNRCRGVGYYQAPSAAGAGRADCDARIIATTVDARLFALDAATGRPCKNFGQDGFVDLKAGLGAMKPGWYYPTSAPLVARGRVIVGGWVTDNQSTDEPGGAVRAFDAVTGKLAWAWDPGRGSDDDLRRADAAYARSTPNFWGTATFDDKLGLVFIPTGNGSPDHWGVKRSKATDKFSTSVIALNVETGDLAWHYQTVHHDLWDWDLSAPPTFADFPDGKGGRIPAIIQVGKAGQIFVLDRRTGTPLTRVDERSVPKSDVPGERASPTQPYSVGMPQVIPQDFGETSMWGVTFFDELACRIQFRKMNFKGQYTPPAIGETPITPGYLGGMNWGGVAIDRQRDILIVNDIRVATLVRLIPHKNLSGNYATDYSHADYEIQPQQGSPYAVELRSLASPLGLPCQQPPWGMITGIDLETRKIAWQIPAGTLADKMDEMVGIPAPFPIGMPTLSSAMVTASGLAFYSGANDAYLRAWDTKTGRLLWKARLPVGAQATPMSYVSPRSGRQYVVVPAGGAPYSVNKGDYIIAFALQK